MNGMGTDHDSPWAAATATLLTKQNPQGVSSPQWWPGGRTTQKARLGMAGADGEWWPALETTVSTASQTVPNAPWIASSEPGHTEDDRQ